MQRNAMQCNAIASIHSFCRLGQFSGISSIVGSISSRARRKGNFVSVFALACAFGIRGLRSNASAESDTWGWRVSGPFVFDSKQLSRINYTPRIVDCRRSGDRAIGQSKFEPKPHTKTLSRPQWHCCCATGDLVLSVRPVSQESRAESRGFLGCWLSTGRRVVLLLLLLLLLLATGGWREQSRYWHSRLNCKPDRIWASSVLMCISTRIDSIRRLATRSTDQRAS